MKSAHRGACGLVFASPYPAHAKAFFEGLGEIGARVARVIELIFIFNAQPATVSCIGLGGDKPLPIDHTRARQPEALPLGIVDRLNITAAHQRPEDFRGTFE